MTRGLGRALAFGCCLALFTPLSRAQTAPATNPPVGELKSLGQDRYQVGRIVIDKRARSFSLPGRVHALGKPLEYLATSPGGMKAYETLFEVDASGSEFNLACILIGLERDPRQNASLATGTGALVGQRVAIYIAWTKDGQQRKVTAAEAVLNPEASVKPESVKWVYTGAPASEAMGRFTADQTGTLIGFKRDLNNVIESEVGIGVGAYGSVRGHPMLPPNGSAIELVVEAVPATK